MMKLATPCYGALRHLLCALALIVPLSSSLAEEFAISSGLSAHWFNPDRSGEGLVLEILSEDAALIYWFTYDEEGRQRWLIDVGEISGNEIIFPELTVASGGIFGPNADPDKVKYEVVGEAILSFSDCNHGEFSYAVFDQSETIPMVRLSQTMAAGCQPIHGVPGHPLREYAGQSGSWYDPAHSGEGYTLQWLSRDEALLIWFSYDPEGNQYWMVGTGHHVDGKIEFPMLHSAQGARFGSAFDPHDVEYTEWGSLTFEIDCDGGTATYDSDVPGFGSGTFQLNRLTQMHQPACPYQAPKLTDLYKISYEELRILPGPPGDPNMLMARDLADDGTVIAFDRWKHQVKMLRPGARDWEALGPGVEIATGTQARISADATRVVAYQRTPVGEPTALLQWQARTGWQELPGLTLRTSVVYGASRNLEYIVGDGRVGTGPEMAPYIWDAKRGQRKLPTTDAPFLGIPRAVSNNGRIVIGLNFVPRPGGAHTSRAVRWVDEGEPEVLVDPEGIELADATACSINCEVIFGMDQYNFGTGEYEPSDGNARQAFYMTEAGGFQYLGKLDDAIEFLVEPPYRISHTSADGTVAVGGYLIEVTSPTGLPMLVLRGLIWTQATGLVSVRELLAELGLGDDDWGTQAAGRITASGDKILLFGNRRYRGAHTPTGTRAAILTLQPRDASGGSD